MQTWVIMGSSDRSLFTVERSRTETRSILNPICSKLVLSNATSMGFTLQCRSLGTKALTRCNARLNMDYGITQACSMFTENITQAFHLTRKTCHPIQHLVHVNMLCFTRYGQWRQRVTVVDPGINLFNRYSRIKGSS